jgi:hypothetical protein
VARRGRAQRVLVCDVAACGCGVQCMEATPSASGGSGGGGGGGGASRASASGGSDDVSKSSALLRLKSDLRSLLADPPSVRAFVVVCPASVGMPAAAGVHWLATHLLGRNTHARPRIVRRVTSLCARASALLLSVRARSAVWFAGRAAALQQRHGSSLTCLQGCSASPLEDNFFVWNATVVGPDETAWEGVCMCVCERVRVRVLLAAVRCAGATLKHVWLQAASTRCGSRFRTSIQASRPTCASHVRCSIPTVRAAAAAAAAAAALVAPTCAVVAL